MRIPGSVLFVFFVVLAIAAYYGGEWAYVRWFILPRKIEPLEPGKLNILGVDLRNERIIVANGIAQLVRGGAGEFSAPTPEETHDEGIGVSKSSETRIPIGALIGALKGDSESLSELVTILNNMEGEVLPREDTIWKASDVLKAIEGDKKLRDELEKDLNTRLDGTPTNVLSKSAFHEGIHIEVSVRVNVPTVKGMKEVTGKVLVPYKTRLVARVMTRKEIATKYDVPLTTYLKVYEMIWEEMKKNGEVENVADSLERIVAEKNSERLSRPAEDLIKRSTVLVTEREITEAHSEETLDPDGEGSVYTVSFSLADEARLRLWQYTAQHPRSQLLLVVDGMAIAAPTVKGEMKYSTAAFTNITERELAELAVKTVRAYRTAMYVDENNTRK